MKVGDLVKIIWFDSPQIIADIDDLGKVKLITLCNGEKWFAKELTVIYESR